MPAAGLTHDLATLTEIVPLRRLVWDRTVGPRWLFAGQREFLIEPETDGSVLVTHVEDVSGLLFPLFRALKGGAIRRHHDGLNDALRERAQAQP